MVSCGRLRWEWRTRVSPNRVLSGSRSLFRSRYSGIVRYDPDDFLICVQFHELRRLCALLIHVAENYAGNSPHHIPEFEAQVWIGFQSALEISAHRFFA